MSDFEIDDGRMTKTYSLSVWIICLVVFLQRSRGAGQKWGDSKTVIKMSELSGFPRHADEAFGVIWVNGLMHETF